MASAAQLHPPRAKISHRPKRPDEAARLDEVLALAKRSGLLKGPKTQTIRARMSVELVARAKAISGIASDSKLLEAALANLVLEDRYGEWLHTHRGSISPEIDLVSLID